MEVEINAHKFKMAPFTPAIAALIDKAEYEYERAGILFTDDESLAIAMAAVDAIEAMLGIGAMAKITDGKLISAGDILKVMRKVKTLYEIGEPSGSNRDA